MKRPHKLPMSAELRSMIANTKRVRKLPYVPPFGTNGRLEAKANKWLARSGFFTKPEVSEEVVLVEADQITTHGLKPTWHGRP